MRMSRSLRLWSLVVAGIFLSTRVMAHGYAVYVSTPVTPPREFLIIPPAFFALLIVVNRFLQRKLWGSVFPRCTWLVIWLFMMFALPFFLWGILAAMATTAPPPGLGTPNYAWWGFGWQKVGSLFLRWNALGLILFLLSVWIVYAVRLGRLWPGRIFTVLYAHAGCYLVSLVPFMLLGALTHGWPGGYVKMSCGGRMNCVYQGIARYAHANGDRLPVAQDVNGLLAEVGPFLNTEDRTCSGRLDICPYGDARERTPKPYIWNPEFSGASIDKMWELFNAPPGHQLPLSCPYHQNDMSLWFDRDWYKATKDSQ